jgi:hypothetical protein
MQPLFQHILPTVNFKDVHDNLGRICEADQKARDAIRSKYQVREYFETSQNGECLACNVSGLLELKEGDVGKLVNYYLTHKTNDEIAAELRTYSGLVLAPEAFTIIDEQRYRNTLYDDILFLILFGIVAQVNVSVVAYYDNALQVSTMGTYNSSTIVLWFQGNHFAALIPKPPTAEELQREPYKSAGKYTDEFNRVAALFEVEGRTSTERAVRLGTIRHYMDTGIRRART